MQFGDLKPQYKVLKQFIETIMTEMAGYSAFKMGKLGKKSEAILIPDFTFFTSAEIFSMKRVIPFFVEADQSTFNIESIDLELKENTEKVCNLMIK